MLPWLLPDASAGRTQAPFDCRTCPENTLEIQRQEMHCGFMPRSAWAAGAPMLPPAFGPDPYDVDICPGWLVQQPAVIEGASAYSASKNGMLPRFDPLGLHRVTAMVEIAIRAFSIYEQERQQETKHRLERSR